MLFEELNRSGIEIHAWVVLTNHYHLLAQVGQPKSVGDVFRFVHGHLSRQWNLEDEAIGRKVWYRYTDRAIRSERHYYTTINYIHYNPVKHGFAKSPYDWKESSVHWYLNQLGREWLRDVWMRHPLSDYGRGWDDL